MFLAVLPVFLCPNFNCTARTNENNVFRNLSVLQKPVIPEASLEGSGVVLRIFHDCTVGVVRKPEAEVQPDVALPYKHFPYGSHIQGKFACMDGVWHFLNVGRNGTRIQMHDQDIMLEPSMSCVIPYDAWITFAEGLPLRFIKKS